MRGFALNSGEVAPLPVSSQAVRVEDEEPLRFPRKLLSLNVGLLRAEKAALQSEGKALSLTPGADLDIAEAGKLQLSGRFEPGERHDDSACGLASAANALKDFFERLSVVRFHILLRCGGRPLCELTVAKSVDETCE